MPTACRGWLCRWIHFRDQGAAWLQTYGQETNVPFIRMKKEADYEFRLACMLLRLRHFILDGDNSQDLIILHVAYYCFNYSYQLAWLST